MSSLSLPGGVRAAVTLLFASLLLLSCEREQLTAGASEEERSANQLPQAIEVIPADGGARTQQFVVKFADGDGASTLEWAQFLVNSELKGDGGCYVQWEKNGNAFYLLDDPATKVIGPGLPGKSGRLENSQCVLDAAASSVELQGNELTLKLAVDFKPSFKGEKQLFIRAQDELGTAVDWRDVGDWKLP